MEDFLWGLWNGLTAWPLLIIHAFGGWQRFPVYDVMRDGGCYQFAFLLGSGSPFLGLLGRNRTVIIADRRRHDSAQDPPAPRHPRTSCAISLEMARSRTSPESGRPGADPFGGSWL